MIRSLLFAAVLLIAPPLARGHDIPDEVRVQAFVKPEGRVLRVLVRVPMKAMREVDVPRRAGGFLDFQRVDTALREAVSMWLTDELELYEDGARLPRPRVLDARVSLESDRAFASYEQALSHFSAARLRNDTELYWSQGLMDVSMEVPIASARSDFAVRPRLERLGIRVNTLVWFVSPDGRTFPFNFHGDPGLVHLEPRWHQAAARFVEAGFLHILDGRDHLLFLLLLVVPLRRFGPLAAVVTAFTVAHSATLISAALGYGPRALWFPVLVEALIAASIVYMAIDNFFAASLRRRWALTLAFGLVHGFGFAYGLAEVLQFAGSHLVTSLVAFNLGVELGQLAVLAILVPLLNFLWKYLPERPTIIVLSLIAGHTAWHWMIERGAELAKFPAPTLDAATLASVLRWAMALLVLGAAAWLGGSGLAKALGRPVHRGVHDEGRGTEERQ